MDKTNSERLSNIRRLVEAEVFMPLAQGVYRPAGTTGQGMAPLLMFGVDKDDPNKFILCTPEGLELPEFDPEEVKAFVEFCHNKVRHVFLKNVDSLLSNQALIAKDKGTKLIITE